MIILNYLLFAIFLCLSIIHVSWALGSSWGFEDAIPKNDKGEWMLKPKKRDSLIVGAGLLLFGLFYLITGNILQISLPPFAIKATSWMIPIIFLFRAIGDFRYIGFTKKVKTTAFARKDTLFYSPLCLSIAVIGFILGIS
ncbi:MAG: DUF3995 domain-containing protein [Ekhidna sp.]